MTASTDPREILNNTAMTRLQIMVVAFTIGLNALDGFDILSISFASPGIAAEWGITRTALGVVLAMELVGMGFGSIFLGGIADKLGRRPTILACLTFMAVGMFMVTTSRNMVELSLWRIITGVGIGGMLSSINAMASEFSSNKRRHLCIAIMTIGYPIGGVVGGIIASKLLLTHDWRSVFYFGTAVTVVFIPLFYFFIPESVHWLARKQPEGALEKINRTFVRMGRATVAALPSVSDKAKSKNWKEIFNDNFLTITIIIAIAYFLHVMTLYFILKWVPKIVVDLGFQAASAGNVLVWTNVGGGLGAISFGLLSLRLDLKKLTLGMLVLAFVFVSIFGSTPADLAKMSLLAAMAGFFCNGVVVGFYALVAKAYPTHARAFGTGFMLGIGRGGAVLSPILAGYLLGTTFGLQNVAIIMGMGSLLAAVALAFLKLPKSPESAEG